MLIHFFDLGTRQQLFQIALQTNQYSPSWTAAIYIFAALVVLIVFLFLLKELLKPPNQVDKGTEMPELPPEIQVWTERQLQQLVQPTNHLGGIIQPLLCQIGLRNREVLLCRNRLSLLHALKDEVRVRLELRQMAMDQKLYEQNSIVEQTLIENRRLGLLSKRKTIESSANWWPTNDDNSVNNDKKPEKQARETARITSPSLKSNFDVNVESKVYVSNEPAKEPQDRNKLVCKLIALYKGHTKSVESVSFSPKGDTLASASLDGTVLMWDGRGKGDRAKNKLEIDLEVSALAISQYYGDLLATGNEDGSITLWSTGSWQAQINLPTHSCPVESVAFSPGGRLLASGSQDREVKIWDPYMHELQRTLSGRWEEISSVAFSPDGKFLAAASWDKSVRLWDTRTWEEIVVFDGHASEGPLAMAFSPNSDVIATAGADKFVRLWEIRNKQGNWRSEELPALDSDSSGFSALAFSPNRKMFAAASLDKVVVLWETSSWRQIDKLEGYTDAVTSVTFSRDSNYIASGCSDKTVRLWEVQR